MIALLAVSAASAGCRGQTSKDSPIFGIRNMYDQPKYEVQEESEFFPDHRTMRPVVMGTVPREQETDRTLSEGRTDDNTAWAPTIPEKAVQHFGSMEALVTRGQERYNIYCAPCHDATGFGKGVVQQRAVASGALAFAPTSYHQDRLRHIPDGQLYATIANGKGNMPPYPQVPMYDRWAIVGYVRALQVSQAPNAPKEEAPAANGGDAGAAPVPATATMQHVKLNGDRILVTDNGFEYAAKLLSADGKPVLGEVGALAHDKQLLIVVTYAESGDAKAVKAKQAKAEEQAKAVAKALSEHMTAAQISTKAVTGIPQREGQVEFVISEAKK